MYVKAPTSFNYADSAAAHSRAPPLKKLIITTLQRAHFAEPEKVTSHPTKDSRALYKNPIPLKFLSNCTFERKVTLIKCN